MGGWKAGGLTAAAPLQRAIQQQPPCSHTHTRSPACLRKRQRMTVHNGWQLQRGSCWRCRCCCRRTSNRRLGRVCREPQRAQSCTLQVAAAIINHTQVHKLELPAKLLGHKFLHPSPCPSLPAAATPAATAAAAAAADASVAAAAATAAAGTATRRPMSRTFRRTSRMVRFM